MRILILILLLNSIVLCQSVETGWKGILTLKTTKTQVDRLLGTPKIDDNGYANYRTEDAFIQVNFSTAPCENNQYKRGRYNVPIETVLDYKVHLKEMVKLTDFKFDREKYEKDTSGDLLNSADYRNFENGVAIGVYIQEETEYVTDIKFTASKKDSEIFNCVKDSQ